MAHRIGTICTERKRFHKNLCSACTADRMRRTWVLRSCDPPTLCGFEGLGARVFASVKPLAAKRPHNRRNGPGRQHETLSNGRLSPVATQSINCLVQPTGRDPSNPSCRCYRDRADQRVFVGAFGVQRQQFADFNSGNVGFNRREVAAILDRSIGLHVVRFHVPGPAGQPDEDDRSIRGGFASRLLSNSAEAQRSLMPRPPSASVSTGKKLRRYIGPGILNFRISRVSYLSAGYRLAGVLFSLPRFMPQNG